MSSDDILCSVFIVSRVPSSVLRVVLNLISICVLLALQACQTEPCQLHQTYISGERICEQGKGREGKGREGKGKQGKGRVRNTQYVQIQ